MLQAHRRMLPHSSMSRCWLFFRKLGVKLFFYSHYFAPSVGGVETVVLSLARGLAELRAPNGFPEFDLTLITETPAEDFDDRILPFRVFRRPSLTQLLGMIRSSDIIHI